jgi:hypothetical protein
MEKVESHAFIKKLPVLAAPKLTFQIDIIVKGIIGKCYRELRFLPVRLIISPNQSIGSLDHTIGYHHIDIDSHKLLDNISRSIFQIDIHGQDPFMFIS